MTVARASRARLPTALLVVTAAGCGQAPVLRGRIDALQGIVVQAERQGARRCAPRELAYAQAELEFARVDVAQGQASSARRHLALAEPDARAALALSPADTCFEAHARGPRPGDRDGDGLLDALDRCPAEPENYNGFQDADGCPDDPDTDGDHVADSVDACVLEAEDVDGYLDDDGCPDPDNDADGVPDAVDRCPNDPEDPDGFQDDDGCPDPDNDRDSLSDRDDHCPDTPGPPGGDKPGCPRHDTPVVVTPREIRITQQIQFETNRAVLKKASYPTLDAVRDVLRAFPRITLEIQGHTDNVGDAARNVALSQARADACLAYLVGHGADAGRLTARGYGPTQPIVPNNSAASRASNRRVQFVRTENGRKP